ncbi:quinone-dependent dihydroorotate dehydrogenase [Oryzifoliimicrobium ureilyticus]|uniref:quinone-dependent dihydroorotate dehydrogenase n=1 Tax=Oryzifoliimicrobium ureilyticus TaxID=3113724 RepID=UPI0030761E56
MKTIVNRLARQALFMVEPEKAHGLSIAALKSGLVPPIRVPRDPRLACDVANLRFPNPLGMAAGYDKNGEVPDALLKLGFGFTEIGTVTPRPQEGNPKPRLFRLVEDEAVINRMGFNNEGHDAVFARIAERPRTGIVGMNIGANKDSSDRIADYVAGIRRFYSVADYFTVNISSPNTPGLRDLQARDSLAALLSAVLAARQEEAVRIGRPVPVFLKIAPDLTEEGMDDIAAEVLSQAVDGLIVSNTTLSRDGLSDKLQAKEAGGLSGRPVFQRSTIVLAKMRKRVGPKLPIIGVGGISSAETALSKIEAGADLIQLYSSMVYGGPGLAADILQGLCVLLDRRKVGRFGDLRDSRLDYWAAMNV